MNTSCSLFKTNFGLSIQLKNGFMFKRLNKLIFNSLNRISHKKGPFYLNKPLFSLLFIIKLS